MRKKDNLKQDVNKGVDWVGIYSWVAVSVVCLTLLVSVFVPDSKIARYKLEVFEVGIFTGFFMWLIGPVLHGRVEINRSLLNIPVMIYLCGFLVFYLAVSNKLVAGQELKRMLLCCGIFFTAANLLRDDKKRYAVILFLGISAFFAAVYGALQHFGGMTAGKFFLFWYIGWALVIFFGLSGFDLKRYKFVYGSFVASSIGIHIYAGAAGIKSIDAPVLDRAMSTFGNPIFFAAFLAITLPVVLSSIFVYKSRMLKLFFAVTAIVMVFAVYFAKTRASWIGLAAGLLAWILLIDLNQGWRWSRFIWKKKPVIAAGIILLIAGHLSLYYLSHSYKNAAVSRIKHLSGIAGRQQAHTLIWRDSLKMWRAHPLTGVGLGSFHTHFPKYASEELKAIWPSGKFIVNDAHNEYIQILSETGVVGFLIIASLFGFYFFRLKRLWGNGFHERNIMIAGFAGGSGALLVQNFFSVDMRFIISSAYLFLLIGLTAGFDEESFKFNIKKDIVLRLIIAAVVAGSGYFVFKGMVKPYRAYQQLKNETNFFDERVLEPAKTMKDLEKLLEEYPDEAKIYEKLGWVYAKEKNWKNAIENYKKASELDPKLVGAFNNLGNISFMKNRIDQAIEYYKKAISIDAKLVDAHMNLGNAYYRKGMLEESADELKIVLDLDPDNYKAISLLKKMTE